MNEKRPQRVRTKGAPPSLEEQIAGLRKFRDLSREIQQPIGGARGQGAAFVLASMREADDCVDGVFRLVPGEGHQAELATPIGVLARSLLEGAIKISYLTGDRAARYRQMENSGLEEFYKHASSNSMRESTLDPMSNIPAHVVKRIKEVRKANKPPKRHCPKCVPEPAVRAPVPAELRVLPSLRDMAVAVGAEWQYDVAYRWESGAVHFSYQAVMNRVEFDEPTKRYLVIGTRPWRLVEVLAVSTTAYAMFLRAAAALLGRGLPESLRDFGWEKIPLLES